jgi:predicted acylesterase/phospholipase RssA
MSYDKKIGLVLQGGGALGSYQAGVYEASVRGGDGNEMTAHGSPR